MVNPITSEYNRANMDMLRGKLYHIKREFEQFNILLGDKILKKNIDSLNKILNSLQDIKL